MPDNNPLRPDFWFESKYPRVKAKYGSSMRLRTKVESNEKTSLVLVEFSEDFMAATLGHLGSEDQPVIYYLPEGGFYAYDKEVGIYLPISSGKLEERISQLFHRCAMECQGGYTDITPLKIGWRNSIKLRGVINKAKGILEQPWDFFKTREGWLAIKNGLLDLETKALTAFSPLLAVRNVLPVVFDPSAKCPKFIEFINQALRPHDVELVQQWSGLLLYGRNICHKLLIFTGVASGGKTTLSKILMEVLGPNNVVTLRPNLLGDRFEIGRFVGRRLLYGADVPSDFLSCKHVSVIKSLVGGDHMTIEVKYSNERIEIKGEFNILVTSNTPLPVYLDSDVEAWGRRLAVVAFQSIPAIKNPRLADEIISSELSGVLNWMIEGHDKLKANNWQFDLHAEQQEKIDDLLQHSESVKHFITTCITQHGESILLSEEMYQAYQQFCHEKLWKPFSQQKVAGLAEKEIEQRFRIRPRNDLSRDGGGAQRGWKGIRLI